MASDPRDRITEILTGLVDALPGESLPGESPAPDELMGAVYDNLRQLARSYLRRERQGHVLEPTALVHEAYLRLVDQTRVDWRGRTHFFAVGAKMMRRVLVDEYRRHDRKKRGGDLAQVTFTEAITPVLGRTLAPEDVLALEDALVELRKLDKRQAQIVELRFFAGLKVDEVAKWLQVSKRTVEADWTHARAWLRRTLAETSP
jgi:RNA polymerase sigma-70 factor (ECF subfamily)